MLSASVTGATSYQWYTGNGTLISGATSASYTTPTLTAAATYYLKATSACGDATSRTATINVSEPPLSAPSGLLASAPGTTSVSVSWQSSAGAHHYALERWQSGAFQFLQDVSGTSATDSAVTANTTYIYRVKAVSATGSSSPYSNSDLATTVAFSALTAGQTTIAAAHFDEMLVAVNAVRAASQLGPRSWADILPLGTPAPVSAGLIRGQHVLSLRGEMNAARAALGFGAVAFTDPVLPGSPPVGVKLIHMTEIRGGAQ